jgi:hypothetical protein
MLQSFKTEITLMFEERPDVLKTVLQIRIRDAVLFDPWIRASGWEKIQIQIQDTHAGSQKLCKQILGYKYFLCCISGSSAFLIMDPGWIWDNMPDLHNWFFLSMSYFNCVNNCWILRYVGRDGNDDISEAVLRKLSPALHRVPTPQAYCNRAHSFLYIF